MEQPEPQPSTITAPQLPTKASRQLSQSTMKRRENKNQKAQVMCMNRYRLEQAGHVLNIISLIFFSVYTFSETTFRFWADVSSATSNEKAIPVLALFGFISILGACLHNIFFVKRQWHVAMYITLSLIFGTISLVLLTVTYRNVYESSKDESFKNKRFEFYFGWFAIAFEIVSLIIFICETDD